MKYEVDPELRTLLQAVAAGRIRDMERIQRVFASANDAVFKFNEWRGRLKSRHTRCSEAIDELDELEGQAFDAFMRNWDTARGWTAPERPQGDVAES